LLENPGIYADFPPGLPPKASALIIIVRAEVSFDSKTIKLDDSSGTYTGPQWLDTNADGDADDAGERKFPISYTRSLQTDPPVGRFVKVTPWFSFSKPLDGSYTIKGVGTGLAGGNLTFEQQVTVNGAELSTTITADDALAVTIDDADLVITWTITNNESGEVRTYGESTDHAYITGADVDNQFETVLAVGCKSAKGLRPAEIGELEPGASAAAVQITEAIWSEFADRNVTKVDGSPLQYWGADCLAASRETPPRVWSTVAALLANLAFRVWCDAEGREAADGFPERTMIVAARDVSREEPGRCRGCETNIKMRRSH
jgi:hypothetical protein